LAALEHGVGSCWVSRFDVEGLAEILNLPQNYLPRKSWSLATLKISRHPAPRKAWMSLYFGMGSKNRTTCPLGQCKTPLLAREFFCEQVYDVIKQRQFMPLSIKENQT